MLREAGEVTQGSEVGGNAALAELCASGDYDVVVCALDQKFTPDVLAEARITGIANYAVGYNNIDVATATERGIAVEDTRDGQRWRRDEVRSGG